MNSNLDLSFQPFVTVIVPVYNDKQRIKLCIEALLKQTYPRDRYEVIVVDNGSTDGTRAAIQQYPVTMLVEDQIQSSYAARNKGLAQARGDVIAFTDSDCIPTSQWMEEGLRAMHAEQADLVGGRVRFLFSPRPTGAEIYDSLSHLKMADYIRDLKGAVTANLFVRRHVITKLGVFPSTMQSGGDMFWTRQATSNGYSLIYAPAAEVGHPTRRLGVLLKRQFRIGKGLNDLRIRERSKTGTSSVSDNHAPTTKSSGKLRKIQSNIKGLLPVPFSIIKSAVERDQLQLAPLTLARVWVAGWLARATTTLGSLAAAIQRRAANRQKSPAVSPPQNL